jgi:hypothetical protein
MPTPVIVTTTNNAASLAHSPEGKGRRVPDRVVFLPTHTANYSRVNREARELFDPEGLRLAFISTGSAERRGLDINIRNVY